MSLRVPRRWKGAAWLAAGYVAHEALEVAGLEVFDHVARLLAP